jgi:hypothetical protein
MSDKLVICFSHENFQINVILIKILFLMLFFSFDYNIECYLNKLKNSLKAMQVFLFITYDVRTEIEYLFVMMAIEWTCL